MASRRCWSGEGRPEFSAAGCGNNSASSCWRGAVYRSLAGSFWTALSEGAAELGFKVEGR